MPRLRELLSSLFPASAENFFNRIIQGLNGPDDFILTWLRNVLVVAQVAENQQRAPDNQDPLSQQYFDWLTHLEFFNLSSFNLELALFLLTFGLYYYSEVYKEQRKRLHNSESYLKAKIMEEAARHGELINKTRFVRKIEEIKKREGLVDHLTEESYLIKKKEKRIREEQWRQTQLNRAERLFINLCNKPFARNILIAVNAINIYTMVFWVIYMFGALHGFPVYSLVAGVLSAGILAGGLGFAVFIFVAPAVLALLYIAWKVWEIYHPKPEKDVNSSNAKSKEKAEIQALKIYRIQMGLLYLQQEIAQHETEMEIDGKLEDDNTKSIPPLAKTVLAAPYIPEYMAGRKRLRIYIARIYDFISGYLMAQFACWPPLAFIGLFAVNPAIAVAFTLGSFVLSLIVGSLYAIRAGVNTKEQNAKFEKLAAKYQEILSQINIKQNDINCLKQEIAELKKQYNLFSQETYQWINQNREKFNLEEKDNEIIVNTKKWKFNPADERQRRTLETKMPGWTWIKKSLLMVRAIWSGAGTMAFVVRTVLFPGGVFLTLAGLFSLTIPISWPVLLSIAIVGAVLWGTFKFIKQHLDDKMEKDIKFIQESKVVLANINYKQAYLKVKKEYYQKLIKACKNEKTTLESIIKQQLRPNVIVTRWHKSEFLDTFFKASTTKAPQRIRIRIRLFNVQHH